jgi:tRNA nucleotidyltransferase/poly(A) polymerase
MAIDLRCPEQLIDPCGGQADLGAKVLRTCTPDSLPADPLRCLRGVRLAVDLDLSIPVEIQAQLRANLPRLAQVSPERVRDELVRMLEGPRPVEAVRLLDRLDGLPYVLPELVALKGVAQTAPHTLDVWAHTLATLQHLVNLLAELAAENSPAQAEDPWLGLAFQQLGSFRPHFIKLAAQKITNQRTRRALLYMAALYHDAAKPDLQTQDAAGRLHAFGHEQAGAELAAGRARALQFSNDEVDYLQTVVRQHMRIHFMAQADRLPSLKAVYHFFRDCGETGPDLCLLSLADTLATYSANLPEAVFSRELEVCRVLLEALWERQSESVRPVLLVNGNELMSELGLTPGPQVGKLLELLREAQAERRITARTEALDLARAWLAEQEARH